METEYQRYDRTAKEIQQARLKTWYWIGGSILLVIIINFAIPDPSPSEEKTDAIKSQFSGWDGSHLGLTKYIKERMNDPDSYEHIGTKYFQSGNLIIVKTKFRGNNAFGGKVINYIEATIDINGHIKEAKTITADEF